MIGWPLPASLKKEWGMTSEARQLGEDEPLFHRPMQDFHCL